MISWAHPSPQPKRQRQLDRFSSFAGLTTVSDRQTDRPTDHATRSVTIGRIYIRSTAMRPNNTVIGSWCTTNFQLRMLSVNIGLLFLWSNVSCGPLRPVIFRPLLSIARRMVSGSRANLRYHRTSFLSIYREADLAGPYPASNRLH